MNNDRTQAPIPAPAPAPAPAPLPHQVQVHTTTHRYESGVVPPPRYEGGLTASRYEAGVMPSGYQGSSKTTHYSSERGPSASQVLAVVAGLPVGGFLLFLSGITLAGTLTGLTIATPLFILFSPVLVPATVVIGLAVAGFLTAGAFGLTALSSFSWILNYIREFQGTVPEQLEAAKLHLADAAGYVGQKTKEVGQKTKEVGQEIQNKAQDAKDSTYARDASYARDAAYARDTKDTAYARDAAYKRDARDAIPMDAKEVKRTTVTATTATASSA